MTYGSKGVMHGFDSIMLKDEKGEPAPVYSIASGLDYPSVQILVFNHAVIYDIVISIKDYKTIIQIIRLLNYGKEILRFYLQHYHSYAL